ncbi:MAG: hypothetical protein ACUVRV_02470 [Cyanobacteriota bacterium]
MALSLCFGSLEGAQAQTSLTAVNRASQMQLNIGGRGSLTVSPTNSGARVEEVERDPSVPSPQMWAKWHIQENVCTGNLSIEELAELFPMVDQALVDEVCRGGS